MFTYISFFNWNLETQGVNKDKAETNEAEEKEKE